MKNKFKTVLFVAILVTVLTFACLDSMPTSVPTNATQVSQPPTQQAPLKEEGKLEITSTSSYVDSYNDYNVVGEIVNNTNEAIENITLSLSVTDETGTSLLKDENDSPVDRLDIQPYIGVLDPGTSAPFSYYLSAEEVQPAKFEVAIKSYDPSSAAKRTEFDIQNVQTTYRDNGDVILTGEVVNLSSEQMDVETLAGALFDSAGKVLAANSTLTYSRYLYPAGDPSGRDRGPFIVTLFGPIKNVSRWKVYVRSVENTTTPSVDVDVQLTGSYVDPSGTYHLLGQVTNNGSSQILPSVIGGLYNSDKIVLDAASSSIPLYLNAGESAPFDLNTFQVINSLPADQTSSAKEIVEPDLYWTFSSDYDVMSLEVKDVQITQDGSDWTISGTVVNTSDKNLGSISAVIQFLDGDQKIMATNSTSIYPPDGSDTIEPGASSDFSIPIYAPEEWDLSSQKYQMILQGVVSQ